MSSKNNTYPSTLTHLPRRESNDARIKKQYAANILQQYSLQALHSVQHDQSPAKTRLEMMRIMTELPKPIEDRVRNSSLSTIKNIKDMSLG
ncbi:unnamed protein product [Cunninghamella blakesleeana]